MKDKDMTREQLTEELIRLRRALKECKKNIASYRQMDEALKESEEKYRLLFENAPVGIGIADFKGNVFAANKNLLKIPIWLHQNSIAINCSINSCLYGRLISRNVDDGCW